MSSHPFNFLKSDRCDRASHLVFG